MNESNMDEYLAFVLCKRWHGLNGEKILVERETSTG
jgi:hypothetical protein